METRAARPLAILLIVAVASCADLAMMDSVKVRSAVNPRIEIECTGDPRLTGDICREWGDGIILGSPGQSPKTSRLLLRYYEASSRCDATFFDLGGQNFAVATGQCPDLRAP